MPDNAGFIFASSGGGGSGMSTAEADAKYVPLVDAGTWGVQAAGKVYSFPTLRSWAHEIENRVSQHDLDFGTYVQKTTLTDDGSTPAEGGDSLAFFNAYVKQHADQQYASSGTVGMTQTFADGRYAQLTVMGYWPGSTRTVGGTTITEPAITIGQAPHQTQYNRGMTDSDGVTLEPTTRRAITVLERKQEITWSSQTALSQAIGAWPTGGTTRASNGLSQFLRPAVKDIETAIGNWTATRSGSLNQDIKAAIEYLELNMSTGGGGGGSSLTPAQVTAAILTEFNSLGATHRAAAGWSVAANGYDHPQAYLRKGALDDYLISKTGTVYQNDGAFKNYITFSGSLGQESVTIQNLNANSLSCTGNATAQVLYGSTRVNTPLVETDALATDVLRPKTAGSVAVACQDLVPDLNMTRVLGSPSGGLWHSLHIQNVFADTVVETPKIKGDGTGKLLTQHLVPDGTNTYDLGTNTVRYRTAYFDYRVYASGGFFNAIGQTSDERTKTNVRPISNALSVINKLYAKRYNEKESGNEEVGFMAQTVEEVPELKHTVHQAGEYKSLSYNDIHCYNVAAVQELHRAQTQMLQKIKELTARIAVLEAR